MKKIILYCAAVSMLFMFYSCAKNSVGCPYQNLNPKAPDSQVVKVKQYLDSKGINALKDSSGLYYIVQTPGSGVTPEVCSNMNVYYTGSLTNDSVFDKTNGVPINITLGALIAGWQKGLPHIKSGGKIRLFIPPYLGYGNTDVTRKDQNTGATVVIIPANSILIFDVELLSVQ